ncbi:tetrahydromethanopterin S-methyltransferase subunit B [Methanocaldococcus villosus KIN24-T80]|uniref:Tetrahydromethanopterin S-methyltransferase subunit B n=1 Tax=Methanocaldococcus villosus KIN24-T80 TaxID=1069083 RepID=N6VTE0_9EURY|nr:tetrahydromethanopterin S-methyltransferase subunit B [Methanocaldococcus villosus]ENN96456.1 tetrahydromethanopterin S-methyltransferase subunit B [Methanocaldococcus villosus KIN24-T80]
MYVVKICPEIDVVMDVDSGLVAEMRKDMFMVDIIPVEERIKKLETLVNAFEKSLDPRNPPLNTFPNRDRVYEIAGHFKGLFFGFWIALVFMLIIIVALYKIFPGLFR